MLIKKIQKELKEALKLQINSIYTIKTPNFKIIILRKNSSNYHP